MWILAQLWCNLHWDWGTCSAFTLLFMRVELGAEPCGSAFIIHIKYHLIVLASTRLTQLVKFLHVNSYEIHCVIPVIDVLNTFWGRAVVAAYSRFITHQRADSVSTNVGSQSPTQSNQAKMNHFKARMCVEGKNFRLALPWRRRRNAGMCAALLPHAFFSTPFLIDTLTRFLT